MKNTRTKLASLATALLTLALLPFGINAMESGENEQPKKEDPKRIKVFDVYEHNRNHSEDNVLGNAVGNHGGGPIAVEAWQGADQTPRTLPTTIKLTDLKADANGITAICSDAKVAADVKAGKLKITLTVQTVAPRGSSDPRPKQDPKGRYYVVSINIVGALAHGGVLNGATLPAW